MAIDAAQAGKHIYIEKPMCQTAEEAKKLRDVVKRTGVILQVGHQNRQQASYIKAREIIDYGILGNISRIKTFTNRNSAWGAWIRDIPPKANSHNINWKEFLGNKQWRKFDLDRYFNWQKWFEYGTGPAGNQFSHSYDCVNQILNLGIPDNVVVSGGNYYYKDPRDIPDVMNAVYNYPDRKCTLTYDCTLQNSRENDITFLGKDATMEVAKDLAVYSDRQSQKYNKYTKSDKEPMFTFHPKINRINAETSATSRYYHERGFGYTYHNGERIDVTYLHMKEWLYCIRNNKQPSCNVKRGFDETVTVDMTNKAYLNENIVKWSKEKETIL
jgi:predicted dehydrogenase